MASGSYNTAMCLNPDEKSVMSPSEDSLKREVILLRRKLQELEKENQSLKKKNNDMQIAVEVSSTSKMLKAFPLISTSQIYLIEFFLAISIKFIVKCSLYFLPS